MLKEISQDDLKRIQLELLEEFAQFCHKNNMTYYLAYGTLLGAVRHQGYIPWDDDIDVMMPRPDYERFLASYMTDSSNPNYTVIDSDLDPDYPISFAKLYDNRTVLIEKVNAEYELGVNIDIFPVDGLPNSEEESKSLLTHILKWRKIESDKLKLISDFSSFKKIRKGFRQFYLKPISFHYINQKIDSLARKYSFVESNFVCVSVYPDHADERFDKNIFTSTTQLLFEGKYYDVPIGYDKFLTIVYGDYMKYPPIEQQVTHHAFDVFYKN